MTVETLTLYRHFCLIDSPIPFELVANPTNPDGTEGRDICSRPAGAWVIDCWKLLPEKFFKLNPVFSMNIKYDESLLREGQKVSVRYSDIDIGEGVAGVNGQLVQISPQSLATLEDYVNTLVRINSVTSSATEANVVINQQNNTALNQILQANSVATDSLVNVSDNNSVVNKLEQIRTVLKSPAQSSSPWSSITNSINSLHPPKMVMLNGEIVWSWLNNGDARLFSPYLYTAVSSLNVNCWVDFKYYAGAIEDVRRAFENSADDILYSPTFEFFYAGKEDLETFGIRATGLIYTGSDFVNFQMHLPPVYSPNREIKLGLWGAFWEVAR